MSRFAHICIVTALIAAIISGCTASTASTATRTAAVQPTLVPTFADPGTAIPEARVPTAAAQTMPPPLVDTPTLAPSLTATPTPEPMSIAALRARSYPGSDITIVQELPAGVNYHRYYAYYLSEGLKIYGLFTVPNGAPPAGGWPAIIFNHGYIPPSVYRTTERYVAYVDGLARSGYIVYKIDYRGHDQSEGEALGAYGDPGYTIDVMNALASIKRYPQANPQKIGMWGHSMGGFLTLRAMVLSPDIKVGVIWSGVVGAYPDMLYRWHTRQNEPTPTAIPGARRWRNNWIREYGTPEQNPTFWNSVSANAFLSDLSGPLQLHASLADEEVPALFSQNLAQEIEASGKTVDLHIYQNDNHNLSNSFSTAMARTIDFYNQYLKSPD